MDDDALICLKVELIYFHHYHNNLSYPYHPHHPYPYHHPHPLHAIVIVIIIILIIIPILYTPLWALPIILSPRKCRNLLPGQGVYLGPATPSKQDGDDNDDKVDTDDKDDNNDKDNDEFEDLCHGDGNQDSIFLYEEPML